MKRLIFTLLIATIFMTVSAQDTPKDTIKKTADTTTNGPKVLISYGFGDKEYKWSKDSTHYKKRYPKFTLGLTLSRLDLGLTTLIDHGSFTLSPQNQFLRYRQWKSSNNGFDFFQMGVRFNDSFKIYLSGGFDWTLIRLRENITILPNQPVLTYRQDSISYSKNRFSASYLRIPISFDFRTKEDRRGNRTHFVIGPIGGFLLDGMVKQISEEHGKQKMWDSYHFASFRYGAFTRIGYGLFGIYAKYYFNNMFEDSPAQDGLRNFSFGFTLGF